MIDIKENILYVVPILLTVAFVTIAERKTMASVQRKSIRLKVRAKKPFAFITNIRPIIYLNLDNIYKHYRLLIVILHILSLIYNLINGSLIDFDIINYVIDPTDSGDKDGPLYPSSGVPDPNNTHDRIANLSIDDMVKENQRVCDNKDLATAIDRYQLSGETIDVIEEKPIEGITDEEQTNLVERLAEDMFMNRTSIENITGRHDPWNVPKEYLDLVDPNGQHKLSPSEAMEEVSKRNTEE